MDKQKIIVTPLFLVVCFRCGLNCLFNPLHPQFMFLSNICAGFRVPNKRKKGLNRVRGIYFSNDAIFNDRNVLQITYRNRRQTWAKRRTWKARWERRSRQFRLFDAYGIWSPPWSRRTQEEGLPKWGTLFFSK